jgi:hypothetical protein
MMAGRSRDPAAPRQAERQWQPAVVEGLAAAVVFAIAKLIA